MSTNPRPQKITPENPPIFPCEIQFDEDGAWIRADRLWWDHLRDEEQPNYWRPLPTAPTVTPEGGEPAPAESATPETDAEQFSASKKGEFPRPCVNADFARRLEAERDQARRERDGLSIDNLALKGENAGLTNTFAAWQEDAKILAQEFSGIDWNQCRDFVPHVRALRRSLAEQTALAELRGEALKPFARFACDEPHVGEPQCFNCIARDAVNATPAAALAHQQEREAKEKKT